MSVFSRKPKLATLHGRVLRCVVCGGGEFWTREVKVNTTGAELFGMSWANQSALGLVCASCGYMHEFVGKAIELWKVEGGYPAGAE